MKCAKDSESQDNRGLRWQQSTMSMALLPWCLQDPKASIVRILKNKIGKYDKELNGIVISYKNVKVLQNFGCIRQDTAEINVDVQIEFLLFQPEVGTKLNGIINKKSVTHLSVLVHKIFNVVIPRPTDDINFKWVGDQLEVGQMIPFTIVVVDLFGALPYIRGDLNEGLLNLAESEEKNSESYDDCSKLTAVKVSFAAAKPKIANNVETNGNNSQSTSDIEKINKKEHSYESQTSSSDDDESNIKKNSKRKDSISSSSSSSDNIKYKDKRKKQKSIQNEPKIVNNKRKRSSVGTDEDSSSSMKNVKNGKSKKIKLETKATKSASTKKTSNAKKVETKSSTDSDSNSSVDDIVSMRNKILQKVLNKTFSTKTKNKKKSKT